MSDITLSCQRTLSLDNNRGFLGVEGGCAEEWGD